MTVPARPHLASYVLAVVPAVATGLVIARYHYDAPWWDAWYMVSLFEKSYDGTLTVRDLWTQYNEHRIILPLSIMLVLGKASGWNHTFEVALTFALSAAVFVLLAKSLVPRNALWWFAPVLSLVYFSVSQWQMWLWGWLHAIPLNLLGAVIAIALLTAPTLNAWTITGATLAGLVSTFSFATGLVLWPLGAAMLVVRRTFGERSLGPLVAWCATGVIVYAAYFVGYESIPDHPPVRNPIAIVAYAFAYLGAPLAPFSAALAFVLGGVGTAVAVWAFWKARSIETYLFPLALAGYAVGCGLITALGRAGFGIEQAVSSRYIPFANLFWIALLAVLVTGEERSKRGAAIPCALIAAAVFAASALGVYRADERYDAFAEARNELVAGGGNEELLRRLTPASPEQREHWIDVLKEHRLSIFRRHNRVNGE